MVINLLAQMASQWRFSKLAVGLLSLILWPYFIIFFANGQFEKSLNATFITLIPKKHAASEIGDCRPISLVEGFIKLLLKSWLIVSAR